jgi:DNA polymerase, archaea type
MLDLEAVNGYKGGTVLAPKKGVYQNLVVVDVISLYPSMALLNNISFETVNCGCCRDNPNAKISSEVESMFNSDLSRKDKKEYWICNKTEGIFPQKLRRFKEERIRQKEMGNRVKQMALKILINSGYGVFGSKFFKYYDPRVAELITAYGRYTLTKMQFLAEEMGLNVIYGDTDSLFIDIGCNSGIEIVKSQTGTQVSNNSAITEVITKFKAECSSHLGVEVEHAKTYKTAIISSKKKHYIGWTGIPGTAPDIVGMEGDKNDRPRWIKNMFRLVVENILGVNGSTANPISTIKKSVSDLELGKVNHELLTRSVKLSKNPEEYHNPNDRKRRLGMAAGARKGDVIEYYETDNNKAGYSLNYQDISVRKYKLMLWKTVRDILEIDGYDISSLENELVFDHNKR